MTLPSDLSIVVYRFCEGVVEGGSETRAKPSPQLQLRGITFQIAARRPVGKAHGALRAWIRCADGIGIRQEFLYSMRTLRAQICQRPHQRPRQITLRRQLPKLRIPDPQVRVNGIVLGSSPFAI